MLTRYLASLPLLTCLSGVLSMVRSTAIFFNDLPRISGINLGRKLFKSNICIHRVKCQAFREEFDDLPGPVLPVCWTWTRFSLRSPGCIECIISRNFGVVEPHS